MRRGSRIAAVTVLYRPGPAEFANLERYADDVGVVIVVDNSEHGGEDNRRRVGRMGPAVYLGNGHNHGVATALNIGAQKAMADGYEYLLTMDQDSAVTSGMVDQLLACFEQDRGDRVGLVAPFQRVDPCSSPPAEPACEPVPYAMTSGSLLCLAAYQSAGPFWDELFIDYVDHEYCMRLRARGYLVMRANRAVLEHALGQVTAHRLFGRPLLASNHSPLRRYYGFRNRPYMYRRHPARVSGGPILQIREVLRDLALICLFEHRRIAKLRMAWRGYLAYRRGLLGPYPGMPAAGYPPAARIEDVADG